MLHAAVMGSPASPEKTTGRLETSSSRLNRTVAAVSDPTAMLGFIQAGVASWWLSGAPERPTWEAKSPETQSSTGVGGTRGRRHKQAWPGGHWKRLGGSIKREYGQVHFPVLTTNAIYLIVYFYFCVITSRHV